MENKYYQPLQGDTARTVADGYQGNFEYLDESKADAQAAVEALATKVDKIEGHSLMSAAEHSKLADIEEQANAYILPAASVTTLGGVKIGDNLTVDAEGRLNAQPGGEDIILSPDAGNALEQRDNGLYVPEGSGGNGEVSDGRIRISGVIAADGTIVSGEGFTVTRPDASTPAFVLRFPSIGERPYVITTTSLAQTSAMGGVEGLGLILAMAHCGLDAVEGAPVYDTESCLLLYQPLYESNCGQIAFEAATLFPEPEAASIQSTVVGKIHIGGVVNADGTIAEGNGFSVQASGGTYMITHPFGSEPYTVRLTPICNPASPLPVLPIVIANSQADTIGIIMQPIDGDDGSCKFAFEAESVNSVASGSGGVSPAEFSALKTRVESVETASATKAEVSAIRTQIGEIGTVLDSINGEEI